MRSQHNQSRAVRQFFLINRRKTDMVRGENVRDLRQHALFVLHMNAQIIAPSELRRSRQFQSIRKLPVELFIFLRDNWPRRALNHTDRIGNITNH